MGKIVSGARDSIDEECTLYNVCDWFNGMEALYHEDARVWCQALELCPEDEKWRQEPRLKEASSINLRVTPGHAKRGYTTARVSLITKIEEEEEDEGALNVLKDELFSSEEMYSSDFKYRWTENHLTSSLVDLSSPLTLTLSDNGMVKEEVTISVPKVGEGVKGLIYADPCFSSEWITCLYKDDYQTFSRTPQLTNSFMSSDEMDFWSVLGDNWYDQDGSLSDEIFGQFSLQTKSKLFLTTPG